MELLADWFAAQVAYDGNWPEIGNWTWVEKRFKHFVQNMHPTTVSFLIGLLCIFGYEKSVMIALYGGNVTFDWNDALKKIQDENQQLANRFQVLWNHYLTTVHHKRE